MIVIERRKPATESRWRNISRNVIEEAVDKALLEDPEQDLAALKRKVSRESYPFGSREMHPYKQWLIEIALEFREVKEEKEEIPEDVRYFWIGG